MSGPDEVERLNIKMIASSATEAEAYIVSLIAERDRTREIAAERLNINETYIVSLTTERDRLREIIDDLLASQARYLAASDQVADIFGRILERGYIDAPTNAGAVAALKRQAAANRRQAREMRAAGRKVREIVKQMGLSERQVYRLLKSP